MTVRGVLSVPWGVCSACVLCKAYNRLRPAGVQTLHEDSTRKASCTARGGFDCTAETTSDAKLAASQTKVCWGCHSFCHSNYFSCGFLKSWYAFYASAYAAL